MYVYVLYACICAVLCNITAYPARWIHIRTLHILLVTLRYSAMTLDMPLSTHRVARLSVIYPFKLLNDC